MNRKVADWLPAEAFDRPGLRRRVCDAVDLWSAKWFAGAALAADACASFSHGLPGHPSAWRPLAAGMATSADSPEPLRLPGLALGADPGRFVLSEVDRDILGRLGEAILDDLAATICATLGVAVDASASDPAAIRAGLAIAVADGSGRHVLRLGIATGLLVPALRAGLGGKGRAPSTLPRLDRALGASPVWIEALLGEAKLSLGELAVLAPGDVLVLDRKLADGASLTFAGSARPFAEASIDEVDETILLTLSSQ